MGLPLRAIAGCLAATTVAMSAGATRPLADRLPTLDEVLPRLHAYLILYQPKLSGLVAEERYEQWMKQGSYTAIVPRGHRTLTSDFIFARLPGGAPWVGFRDTFLVDGRLVREHAGRLPGLLLEGSESALEQAARIVAENARYNLADDDVYRNINTPLLALDLLLPHRSDQFNFRSAGESTLEGRRVLRLEFTERTGPPIIRPPDGAELFTDGTAWVETATGMVVRTVLDIAVKSANDTSRARITVSYRRDPQLGYFVPHEMRESHTTWVGNIEAIAKYSKYRQYQTSARVIVR